MSAEDPLLQPYQLKHLKIRNRILSTAHEPGYGRDGMPDSRYQAYQEERARGGIGLTMFGGSALVARESPRVFGNLDLADDAVIPYMQTLAERIHHHGAAAMCQISHMGRRASAYEGHWLPTLWPSSVREPAHRSFPKTMETYDIARVVKAYGQAARRCLQSALDGIEIESYGHLFDSFWTPRMNFRRDQYGGSLDNRLRFSFEVLEEIRKQVGGEFIIGVRMVFDEEREDGLNLDEGMEIASRFAASGMIDFINVIKGHVDTDQGLSRVIPNMGTPSAPQLEFTRAIKAELDIPIFHAARINDVATARHAIATRCVDLVGMTRAHMADPHIAAKIARGEESNIRPCVGVGYCLDRLYGLGISFCAHNPATGREETMPHSITPVAGTARKIVVVGAGPAGLEAARVCAERGHDVVLFEATDRPGGQVAIAARVERRREIIGITDWLYAQCQRLAVVTRFNQYVESADVLAEQPDIVIVATGGQPNTEFLAEGSELVTTTWDILTNHSPVAADVLLFDDHGQHQAMSCAEHMISSGARLEIATPDRAIGQELGSTTYPVYLNTFHQHNVSMTTLVRLVAVRRRADGLAAVLRSELTGSQAERVVDQVVVEHGTLPVDDLYFTLKERSINLGELDVEAMIDNEPQAIERNAKGKFKLFRVGDAVASRNIHSAIYDSLRLCKDL